MEESEPLGPDVLNENHRTTDILKLKAKILGINLALSTLNTAKHKIHAINEVLKIRTSELATSQQTIEKLENSLKELGEIRTVALGQLNKPLDLKSQQLAKAKQDLQESKGSGQEQSSAKQATNIMERRMVATCIHLAETLQKNKQDLQESKGSGQEQSSAKQATNIMERRMVATCIHLAETLQKNSLLNSHFQSQLEEWKSLFQDRSEFSVDEDDVCHKSSAHKFKSDQQEKKSDETSTSKEILDDDVISKAGVNSDPKENETQVSTKNVTEVDIIDNHHTPAYVSPHTLTYKQKNLPQYLNKNNKSTPHTRSHRSTYSKQHKTIKSTVKERRRARSVYCNSIPRNANQPQIPSTIINPNIFHSPFINPIITNMNQNLQNYYPMPFMIFNPQHPYQLQSIPEPYPVINVPYLFQPQNAQFLNNQQLPVGLPNTAVSQQSGNPNTSTNIPENSKIVSSSSNCTSDKDITSEDSVSDMVSISDAEDKENCHTTKTEGISQMESSKSTNKVGNITTTDLQVNKKQLDSTKSAEDDSATIMQSTNKNSQFSGENSTLNSAQSKSIDNMIQSSEFNSLEMSQTNNSTSVCFNGNKESQFEIPVKKFSANRDVGKIDLTLEGGKKAAATSSTEVSNHSSVANTDLLGTGLVEERKLLNRSSNLHDDVTQNCQINLNSQEKTEVNAKKLSINSATSQKGKMNNNSMSSQKTCTVTHPLTIREESCKKVSTLRPRKFKPNITLSASKIKHPPSHDVLNTPQTRSFVSLNASSHTSENILVNKNIYSNNKSELAEQRTYENESCFNLEQKLSTTDNIVSLYEGECDDDVQSNVTENSSSLHLHLSDSSETIEFNNITPETNTDVTLEESTNKKQNGKKSEIKEDMLTLPEHVEKSTDELFQTETSDSLNDLQVKLLNPHKIGSLETANHASQVKTRNNAASISKFQINKEDRSEEKTRFAPVTLSPSDGLQPHCKTLLSDKSQLKKPLSHTINSVEVPGGIVEILLSSDDEVTKNVKVKEDSAVITTPRKRKFESISNKDLISNFCPIKILKTNEPKILNNEEAIIPDIEKKNLPNKFSLTPAKLTVPPKRVYQMSKPITSKLVQPRTRMPVNAQTNKSLNTLDISGVSSKLSEPSSIKIPINGNPSKLAQPIIKMPIVTQVVKETEKKAVSTPLTKKREGCPGLLNSDVKDKNSESVKQDIQTNVSTDDLKVKNDVKKPPPKKLSKLEKVRSQFTKSHPIVQGSIALKKANAYRKMSEKNLNLEKIQTDNDILNEVQVATEMTPSRNCQVSNKSLTPKRSLISPSQFSVPPLLSPITENKNGELQMIKVNCNKSSTSVSTATPTMPKICKLTDAKPLKNLSKIPVGNTNVKQIVTTRSTSILNKSEISVGVVNMKEKNNKTEASNESKLQPPTTITTKEIQTEIYNSNTQAVPFVANATSLNEQQQKNQQAAQAIVQIFDTLRSQGTDVVSTPIDHLVSKAVKRIAEGPLEDLSGETFTSATLDSIVCKMQGAFPGNSLSHVAEAILLVVVTNSVNEADQEVAPNSFCLTRTQRRVLALVHCLEKTEQLAGIEDTLITIIPSCIVNTNSNSQYRSVKQLCGMIRIMVYLCKKKCQVSPLRNCLYLALVNLRKKSSAISYEMLKAWPDILPQLKGSNHQQAKFSTIKELPIVMQCIIYALLRFNTDEDKSGENKMLMLRTLLNKRYNYFAGIRSALDVVQHIVQRLISGEIKGVECGLLLMSCCEGTEWTKKFLIEGELQHVLNKHAESLQADKAAQVAARLIGVLLQRVPLPDSAYVAQTMKSLIKMMHKPDVSEALRENIGIALQTLARYIKVPPVFAPARLTGVLKESLSLKN